MRVGDEDGRGHLFSRRVSEYFLYRDVQKISRTSDTLEEKNWRRRILLIGLIMQRSFLKTFSSISRRGATRQLHLSCIKQQSVYIVVSCLYLRAINLIRMI
jgi:hypothetical protein